MKVKELMDFLSQFNQEAEFNVVMPDGIPIDVNKNNFGWSTGGDCEKDDKSEVVELCMFCNNNNNNNNCEIND